MSLWSQLIKGSSFWIRFELGLIQLEGKQYFEEMNRRAITILNSMIDKDDELLLILNINRLRNSKRIVIPNIKRLMRCKKQIYGLKCETLPFEFDEEDVEMETKQYSLRVKKDDIRIAYLIQLIGNKDFAKKPMINGSCYLLNLTKETLFHMYDDRGCDVYGIEKSSLIPIYKNFKSWILDYNRIQIDRMFGNGLFNIYETPDESEKRLNLNRKKIRESEINLFEDNTCYITHKLMIPINRSQECIEEIKQTGFEVMVDTTENEFIKINITKKEALGLINYQTELMSLYSKKYQGMYNSWSASRA
ncbi:MULTISPECIES: DUF3885 domain-containing protein [Bacillaceae]|uniref:DUF3885 domain-containing protein n=1 Tax=Gottfriedia luciferensis TaxID=178774 RepID=A0ABX2ZVE7_9BACI|nr:MULTISPECIES: DUF3885 domain-containing protein [Bacillaceae]ODG93397.1 hypothetical protein BED47_03665 [Gottfriedia luciferensis]PGZ88780.1 DUF3885 domain-containing protein [Bacillus sp. AFS029533]